MEKPDPGVSCSRDIPDFPRCLESGDEMRDLVEYFLDLSPNTV